MHTVEQKYNFHYLFAFVISTYIYIINNYKNLSIKFLCDEHLLSLVLLSRHIYVYMYIF